MLSKTPLQTIVAAPRMSRSRALKAGLALAAACLIAGPALADTVTAIPGGEVHSWTGDHGEDFQVTRTFNNGRSTTRVNRHDGRGWVLFATPPKPPILRIFSGSLFDPDTNMTTTIVVGPTFRGSSREEGNRLREHGDMQRPKYTGRASGSLYNPDTNETTTVIHGPTGSGRMVEPNNTLPQHDKPLPKKTGTGSYSGAAYDPDTNRTTYGSGGPNGSTRGSEPGNTLHAH